jgi:site-specific recombinase XerD
MNFFAERDMKMRICLNRILLDMPPFCRMFFFGKEQMLCMKSLYERSFVIRYFFNFVSAEIPAFDGRNPTDFSLADLDNVQVPHIERYIDYLAERNNSSGTIGGQVYTLNVFFRYYYRLGEINHNPLDRIDAPKRKEKPIIRLTAEETKRVLAAVDNGYRVKNGKRRLGKNHLLRDKTILVLFLSTGIRLSELVGLDFGDIDLDNACFTVRRKGGKREICYMTVELVEQLKIYLSHFPKTAPSEPLFMSIYKCRAGTASIQALVKNYCKVSGIERKITPHKLRSTFGTQMYDKTRDIYLVADLLGHKDVRTTTKHYTTVKEEIKRKALKDFQIT